MRRLIAAAAVVLVSFTMLTGVATAQEVPGGAPVADVLETITLNATVVLLLVNFLLPIVNGIILKANPRPLVAQVLSLFTSSVSVLIVQNMQVDGAAVLSSQTLLLAAVAFGTQVASYLGVWKPHDVNGKTGPGLLG